MQQAHQPVALGHLLHRLHDQLVLVVGGVGVGIDGSHLVLGGGHLVVLRLGEHAELPELLVEVLHIGRDARADGAEVVVVKLLSLGRLVAKERAPAQAQILALQIERAVDQEVLLLCTDLGRRPAHLLVAEEPQDLHRLAAHGLHRAQQRCLLVERLAAVGAEHRRDAEATVLDEGERRGVPRAVAAGLERRAQTAGGEAGGIRFAADKLLA